MYAPTVARPALAIRPPAAQFARASVICFAILSLGSIAFRVAEMHGSPLAWTRAGLSLVALAVLFGLRGETFAKRAALALCVEAAGAVAIFSFVDVPMVEHHQREIGEAAVGSYAILSHRDLATDLAAAGLIPARDGAQRAAATAR